MANNQIAPAFLNFANNVSLSQNKWNDSRLHQNKGCYYNNLLSPFWKKKESFTGLPFQDGNDVYTLTEGTLYKNGTAVLSNIPDGYTYDVLSYEVLAAFSNYDGEHNYRFYRQPDNTIQIDFNGTVTDLGINEDFAAAKIIQLPTKTGYQASFGMLTVYNRTNIEFTWRNIHYKDSNDINIENYNFVSHFSKLSDYVIVGGLCLINGSNGTWAGFSIFPERGWQTHNRMPYGVLINVDNLSQSGYFGKNEITVTNVTPESIWKNYTRVHDGYREYDPEDAEYTWRYSNEHYETAIVTNPKTYFYFCKKEKVSQLINDTDITLYGFEMWVRNKDELNNSSLQLGNSITLINNIFGHFNININSNLITMPCNGYQNFGAGFYSSDLTTIRYDVFTDKTKTANWSELKSAFQFNFASASYITEDYQENIYCGYHKISVKHISDKYGASFDIFQNETNYISIGYEEGNIHNHLNVFSEKTFDNLLPGDNVKDIYPKMYKISNEFYLALGSDDTVYQNVVSPQGCALIQWNNIEKLIFGEKDIVYGQFADSKTWFKIKKCPAYIVNKFNQYILINCDGLNAYNPNTNTLEKCWAIGYNGALNQQWTSYQQQFRELTNFSRSSLADIKVAAGAVNNNYSITQDYFTASSYNFISFYDNNESISVGYNYFDYEIELYTGAGTNPIYEKTIDANSAQSYINNALIGQAYVFSTILYSYFLCQFGYEYYFNRFGVIDLGQNKKTNIRFVDEINQITQYALLSILEYVENVFIVQGQIYMIKSGYIFAIILDNNFLISYQNPITECKKLIFCGNTSKYAFFYSPLTKCFYRFNGSQIFEYLQDASDVVDIITYKNNYYMNVSLISFLDAEGHNKVLMIQGDYSVICWEDTDDLDELNEGNIGNIVIEKDRIYLVTTQQNVYSIMFYDNKENFAKLRLEYESETLLNDFSQNIIDCVYVNVMKKGLPYGKVWVSLVSGSGETKQEFNLKELMEDRNGLSLIRYQPKFQQRGRVAIRVESEVPVENIAYTVKTVGNEISHKRIEI